MATTRRTKKEPTPPTFNYDAGPGGILPQTPEPLSHGDEVVRGQWGGQVERLGELDGGEALPPLDPDLAALARGGDERQQALEQRTHRTAQDGAANRVPLVYVGIKEGVYIDVPPIIALNAPRPTDEAAIRKMHAREMVDRHPASPRFGLPLERDANGCVYDERELAVGRRTPIDGSRLHCTGPTHTFVLDGPSVLVDEGDVDFFLTHPVVAIERADTPERVAASSRTAQELAIAAHLFRLATDSQAREQAEQLAQARQAEADRLRSTTARNQREGRTYGGATRPQARP